MIDCARRFGRVSRVPRSRFRHRRARKREEVMIARFGAGMLTFWGRRTQLNCIVMIHGANNEHQTTMKRLLSLSVPRLVAQFVWQRPLDATHAAGGIEIIANCFHKQRRSASRSFAHLLAASGCGFRFQFRCHQRSPIANRIGYQSFSHSPVRRPTDRSMDFQFGR